MYQWDSDQEKYLREELKTVYRTLYFIHQISKNYIIRVNTLYMYIVRVKASERTFIGQYFEIYL